MATYTFIAHDINVVGGNINVVGSSTYTIVLTDDDPVIGQPGDTGEMVSIDGGAPQPYTFLGAGVTDNGEDMIVIEIAGVQYAFDTDGGQLENGNTKVKIAALDDTPTVPCFTTGTMIRVAQGQARAVEELRDGDMIMTRDAGLQPIAKIIRRDVSVGELAVRPHLTPVCIKAHALGTGRPTSDLVVSPQHRMLVDNWRAELFFGAPEILATAKSLQNDFSIVPQTRSEPVTYFHIILDQHHIIYANDAPTESVLLSHDFLKLVDPDVRAELRDLFPSDVATSASCGYDSAAMTTKHHEGLLLW